LKGAETIEWRYGATLEGAERSRRGQVLLALARRTIERALDGGAFRSGWSLPRDPKEGWEPWLLEPGAVFVSLLLTGELRGCIGSVEPFRRLVDDVRSNAHQAAFADPRFAPLGATELRDVRLEVSLLGPLEPMVASTFEAAAQELRPGLDGVLLSSCHSRATLLPQVWRSLPGPLAFLAALERKAGLQKLPEPHREELRFYRYQVESWLE
jgi:AmmeMemoRadiSam system protein A